MKKITTVLFVLLSFLSAITLSGQNQKKVDSLQSLLSIAKTDTQKIVCYVELARELRNKDREKALQYAQQAYDLGQNSEYPYYKAKAIHRLAASSWNSGKNVEAFELSQKALLIYEGLANEKGKMECYLTIGNCYSKNNLKKAEEFYIKALKIAEKINDKYTIAATYGNIGAINSGMGNITASIEYTKKAVELFRNEGQMYNYCLSLQNIAGDKNKLGNYNEALTEIRKTLGYYSKEKLYPEYLKSLNIQLSSFYGLELKDSATKMINTIKNFLKENISLTEKISSYSMIEFYFARQDKLDSAQFYFEKCMPLAKESNDEFIQMQLLNNYAEFCKDKLNDPKKTCELYDQMLPLALKLNQFNYVWLGYYFRGAALKKLKRFEDAANSLDSSVIMKDSLDKINEAQKLSGLLEEHKMAEMEGNFKDVENQNKLKEKELEKAATERYSLIGGLLVGTVLMGVTYRSYRRKKKDNKILENQKKEIEEKNGELNHANAVIAEKNKSIVDSINYAQKIQQATLTSEEILKTMFKECFVFYKPKDILSGDFYWAHNIPEKSLQIWAVGDCTGHGVPGALMSMLGNMFLNEIVIENNITDPGEILNKLREKIIVALDYSNSGQRDGMDIALCAWNKNNNQLYFAGANNSAWIIRNGILTILPCDKMPIGIFDTMLPFTVRTIDLSKNDIIYISSDGYSDQFGGEGGKKFKSSNFRTFVTELSAKNIKEQENLIIANFEKWKGNHEQTDDVCVLVVKI